MLLVEIVYSLIVIAFGAWRINSYYKKHFR